MPPLGCCNRALSCSVGRYLPIYTLWASFRWRFDSSALGRHGELMDGDSEMERYRGYMRERERGTFVIFAGR